MRSLALNRLLNADVTAMRFTALVAAMAMYALLGSPSPDNPGGPEIFIGLMLVLAAGLPTLMNIFIFNSSKTWWQSAGAMLLLYGLVIVLPVGAIHGNEMKLMLRDLAPFLFLFLPLFAGDIFEKRPDYLKIFILVFCFMGLAFSVRALGEADYFKPGAAADTKELYYFANAPSVLFAAVFPAGIALERYLRTLSIRSACFVVAAACFVFVPLLAMAFTLQRASLGWAGLSFLVFGAVGCWRAPLRMLVFLPLAGVLLFFRHDQVFTVFELLSHKTAIYGVNKRGMEMAAVWREISGTPLSMIFGTGWGGTFESPAVGGARINFTHSFISATMLKTGFAGLFFAVAYMSGFFVQVYRLLSRDIILTMALAGPLFIDVFLYASYKWLDFGLLLLLITGATQLHRPAAYCIHKGNA